MIVENGNYIIDPVVMATNSYRLACGDSLYIESLPVSYEYLEFNFKSLDDHLDEVNYWLDKANEEGER